MKYFIWNIILIQFVTSFGLMAPPLFGMVEEVLPPLQVDKSNINGFASSVAYYKGAVYTVDVQPAEGVNNGINLLTVVRKGEKNSLGQWIWSSHVLENQTLEDPYHTQGSIAVDKNGYIHVAYNMHNMPWQYAVSEQPGDINSFVFRGDPITTEDRYAVKHLNSIAFSSIGTAAIPGNQITYPAFFVDRNHDLYITYRYATRPKRAWSERGFSGGIAKYDIMSKTWQAIGGPIPVTNEDADLPGGAVSGTTFPFAYKDQWTVYLIRLGFDGNNGMHLSWMWREGGAGMETTYPSYAFSPDGGKSFFRADASQYLLPIDVTSADVVIQAEDFSTFFSPTSISIDSQGTPWTIMQPIGPLRMMVHFDRSIAKWSKPEPTPFNAKVFMVDGSGQQWAFSPGIRILRRRREATSEWEIVYSDIGYCHPSVFTVFEEKVSYIHLQTCDNQATQKIKIIRFDWGGRPSPPINLSVE